MVNYFWIYIQRVGYQFVRRYETYMEYLDELAAAHPEFVTLSQRGKTHQNRKLMMVKIGTDPEGDSTRAVWIDAGNLTQLFILNIFKLLQRAVVTLLALC